MIILRSGFLEYVIKSPIYDLRNIVIYKRDNDFNKKKEFNVKSIPIYERLISLIVYFQRKSIYASEDIRKIGLPRLFIIYLIIYIIIYLKYLFKYLSNYLL